MTFPSGYHGKNNTRVCKVLKSLYGLKQTPRKWNEKLRAALFGFGFGFGFAQSINDYSMFVKYIG